MKSLNALVVKVLYIPSFATTFYKSIHSYFEDKDFYLEYY